MRLYVCKKNCALILADQAAYRFDIKGNSFFKRFGGCKIPLEDYRPREAVCEIIIIDRGDRDVQLGCVNAIAKDIFPNPPIQKRLDAADEFLTDRLQCGRVPDMGGLTEVLAVHKGDELRIGDIVFPCETDERFECCPGGQVLQIQSGLFLPDVEVFPLQDGAEEAVLTFEVVVEHPLVGLGIEGDRIDPRAFKPVSGKLLLRRFENA